MINKTGNTPTLNPNTRYSTGNISQVIKPRDIPIYGSSLKLEDYIKQINDWKKDNNESEETKRWKLRNSILKNFERKNEAKYLDENSALFNENQTVDKIICFLITTRNNRSI